jgi:CSLREA domain-containing protein
MKRLVSLLIGLFIIGLMLSRSVQAATFTVNSTTDAVDASPGDGICETAQGNGVCTLRAAIQEANALAGADTITLSAGTYNLTITGTGEDVAATGDLDITQDLIITGSGSAATIVDGGAIDRVFQINASVVVSISDITIRNGDPINVGGVGGGVYNIGTLTLTNCIVSGNTAGFGGGIYTDINTALTLNNVTISSNTVGTYGGGIYKANNASVTINGSTIRNNSASPSSGYGGGIYTVSGASMTIDNTTISNNTASLGGGIVNDGGALLTITNSTITGNMAYNRGGFSNAGTMNLTNVTVSGNMAYVSGGGISNAGASATAYLNNVTITNNTADADNAGGGGGGGIEIGGGGTVNLHNTIIAGNTVGASGSAPDCFGTLTSQGYNLIQNTNGCTISGSATGNLIGQNPNLGSLADNGGPTQTHALLAGSPAIDAGDNSLCPAIDQRGFARPQDGDNNSTAVCDMGAYELALYSRISVSPQSYDFGSIAVGSSAAALEITISSAGTRNLNITGMTLSDTVNYSLNANGGSNPCGGTALTLGINSSCTITVTFTPQATNSLSATLTISSDYFDAPNLNISLTGTGVAQSGGNTSGGGGGGGGCGGFIQDAGNKNRDNGSLVLSFILMLIISLTGISLARRVIRA